jgi:hypothetical protein
MMTIIIRKLRILLKKINKNIFKKMKIMKKDHSGKDLGKAQGFASGEARIKARMTCGLCPYHGGKATMASAKQPAASQTSEII